MAGECVYFPLDDAVGDNCAGGGVEGATASRGECGGEFFGAPVAGNAGEVGKLKMGAAWRGRARGQVPLLDCAAVEV